MHILLIKTQAYLDPGSGSILLQVILAGLLGFGLVLKVYWKKVVSFFQRKSGDNEPFTDDE